MADLWKTSIRHEGEEYELTLVWDAAAFEDGAPTVSVQAAALKAGLKVEASVSLRAGEDGRPEVVLLVNGEKALSVPLSELINADQFIESIPAWVYGGGHPVVGCLLRAGISATVGQILTCRRLTVERPWFKERARAIGVCLKDNFAKMGARAARRAVRCLLRAGF